MIDLWTWGLGEPSVIPIISLLVSPVTPSPRHLIYLYRSFLDFILLYALSEDFFPNG